MKTGYKVGEVMTQRPIVVSEDSDLVTCVQIMRDNNVGAILVTENKKLKGILTEQDIAHKVVGENRIPKKSRVKDIMETEVLSTDANQDIFDAILQMREMNIRHLPVIDGKELVGLLTLKDILKIQPQLFDLIVRKFELREENNKPINKILEEEGICNICGEYSQTLKFVDEAAVCDNCNKDQQNE